MPTEPDNIADLKARLEEAFSTTHALQAENERLRRLLDPTHREVTPPSEPPPTKVTSALGGIDTQSSESAKIALFRSLFRGREDVYAYRWDGRDGRSGYSPPCGTAPGGRRGNDPTRKSSFLSMTTLSAAISSAAGSLAFTRCSRMRPVGSWRLTLTSRPGSPTWRR
jgi:hypothetical protein